MGFRFRRTINLGSGLKINLNKKSIGLSFGIKGAHTSINSKGQRTSSVGIPGSGVSYISRSSGASKSKDLLTPKSTVPFYLNWIFITILFLTLYGILPAILLSYLRIQHNKKISAIDAELPNE